MVNISLRHNMPSFNKLYLFVSFSADYPLFITLRTSKEIKTHKTVRTLNEAFISPYVISFSCFYLSIPILFI